MSDSSLPAITLAVEWDNAADVDPIWVSRHLDALCAELARCHGRWQAAPRVVYLFDGETVAETEVERALSVHAPELAKHAELCLVSIPGGDYFGLKAAGITGAATELVVAIDCDTAPQPGFFAALLAPFADPDVVAAFGFTTIAIDGLVSKVCALGWVFPLPSDAHAPSWPRVYANNFAVRADYFRAHPWRSPRRGKKGGGPFRREIERSGRRWVQVPGAHNVHAPHRSAWFHLALGWKAGSEQDWVEREKPGGSRARRVRGAAAHYRRRLSSTFRRIVTRRREVGLSPAELPAALALVWAHWTATFVAQLGCALRR